MERNSINEDSFLSDINFNRFNLSAIVMIVFVDLRVSIFLFGANHDFRYVIIIILFNNYI